MIDTIKICIPADYTKKLKSIFFEYSSTILKLDSVGDLVFEFDKVEYLPSSYSNIHISFYNDKCFLEFSLQKAQSSVKYNHKNTNLIDDYVFLVTWWARFTDFFGLHIPFNCLMLYRLDLAVNFILDNNVDFVDFFRDAEISFSRLASKRVQYYDSAIYYPSRWITKKLYHKQSELNSLHRKSKINKNSVYSSMSELEINLFPYMYRFELEFRKMALKSKNVVYLYDLFKLKNYYDEEVKTFLGSISNRSGFTVESLPNELYVLYSMVEKDGYHLGTVKYKNRFSLRTYYRNKKRLRVNYGIDLRAITTSLRRNVEEKETNYFFYEAL